MVQPPEKAIRNTPGKDHAGDPPPSPAGPWYGEIPDALRGVLTPPARCPECNYDLQGSSQDRPCPECGYRLDLGVLVVETGYDPRWIGPVFLPLSIFAVVVLTVLEFIAMRSADVKWMVTMGLALAASVMIVFILRHHLAHPENLKLGKCLITAEKIQISDQDGKSTFAWNSVDIWGTSRYTSHSTITLCKWKFMEMPVTSGRIRVPSNRTAIHLAAFLQNCQDRLIASGAIDSREQTSD